MARILGHLRRRADPGHPRRAIQASQSDAAKVQGSARTSDGNRSCGNTAIGRGTKNACFNRRGGVAGGRQLGEVEESTNPTSPCRAIHAASSQTSASGACRTTAWMDGTNRLEVRSRMV